MIGFEFVLAIELGDSSPEAFRLELLGPQLVRARII